jgi:hypothetical protein
LPLAFTADLGESGEARLLLIHRQAAGNLQDLAPHPFDNRRIRDMIQDIADPTGQFP